MLTNLTSILGAPAADLTAGQLRALMDTLSRRPHQPDDAKLRDIFGYEDPGPEAGIAAEPEQPAAASSEHREGSEEIAETTPTVR